MTNPSLFDWTPSKPRLGNDFGGETFDKKRDGDRLGKQLQDVFDYMSDGQWHTLRQISDVTGHPEASISARLRDCRKHTVLGATVEREFVSKGLWRYRLLLGEKRREQ